MAVTLKYRIYRLLTADNSDIHRTRKGMRMRANDKALHVPKSSLLPMKCSCVIN